MNRNSEAGGKGSFYRQEILRLNSENVTLTAELTKDVRPHHQYEISEAISATL